METERKLLGALWLSSPGPKPFPASSASSLPPGHWLSLVLSVPQRYLRLFSLHSGFSFHPKV